MRFTILLLLTLGLVMPAAQAAQPMTPQLNKHIRALDRISFCRGLKSAEMMHAFEQNIDDKITDEELQAVIASMGEQEYAFTGASHLFANYLTAALIVDNKNIFNELIQQQEQRASQYQEQVAEHIAKGTDLSSPLKECSEQAKTFDSELSKNPDANLLVLLEEGEQLEAQALLHSAQSDTRCALIALRAKKTFGTDEHSMVTLFDFRRKLSFESYLEYLEDVAPSRSRAALGKFADSKLMPHLVSLSGHWDEIDDAAKKEWVGHCRQIQKSLSN